MAELGLSGEAPPPYDEPAPNGVRYFKVLYSYLVMAEVYARLQVVRDHAVLKGGPVGDVVAGRLTLLQRQLVREIRLAQVEVAVVGTEASKAAYRAVQRRPTRGQALINHIHSEPFAEVPELPTFGVGIASVESLDKAADSQGRPYWRAQEFGSDHLVNDRGGTNSKGEPANRGVLYGAFMPGAVPPSEDAFRNESSFLIGAGGPYKMVIKRPIPPKKFLRRGAAAAEKARIKAAEEIAASAAAELEALIGLLSEA